MDTAEALRQGRDKIEAGWFKGSCNWGGAGRSEGGPSFRCAWLAIEHHDVAITLLEKVVYDNWLDRVQEGIQRFGPGYIDDVTDPDVQIDHLIVFNNHPDTTRDEVLAAYDKAIVRAEELI